ncbi:MAG: hypothetical protein KDJ52_28945 [Anaerolineae bacterium]|nr:hypothetical protein [Anaerolineae bacterium]
MHTFRFADWPYYDIRTGEGRTVYKATQTESEFTYEGETDLLLYHYPNGME